VFQPTHSPFELGFNAHHWCSSPFVWRASITADRGVPFTIRQPHAGRRLRDESGPILRTFVVKDPLPMEGRFHLLTNSQTELGPGQAGYLGGRWWVDENGNGVQDSEDHFFLCPLLPPGRPTP
jgi:hypothetical protein